jgi:hypothetical protein
MRGEGFRRTYSTGATLIAAYGGAVAAGIVITSITHALQKHCAGAHLISELTYINKNS